MKDTTVLIIWLVLEFFILYNIFYSIIENKLPCVVISIFVLLLIILYYLKKK